MKDWGEDWGYVAFKGCVIFLVAGLLTAGLFLLICIHWQPSEELVSGIVYNNKNDKFISHNTSFYIRAGVDTYINETNETGYCLPPGSPYIPIVKEAAEDKSIRVVVKANKKFQIMWPWQCMDNVVVEKENK